METNIKIKKCSKCQENKNIELFGIKKYNNDGLNHYCKECENKRSKLKYSKPEFKDNKKYYQIERKYGLTKGEYFDKLKNQNNKCNICEVDLLNDKDTHIDHSHNTGKVRDILCKKCNNLLGSVNEDIDYLNRLINYINKHS